LQLCFCLLRCGGRAAFVYFAQNKAAFFVAFVKVEGFYAVSARAFIVQVEQTQHLLFVHYALTF